jgi:hypothetical protein
VAQSRDRDGARHEGEEEAGDGALDDLGPAEPVEVGQQSEHHEEPDLSHPADPLGEGLGGVAVGQIAIADHHGGHVDRGESRDADPHSETVGQHPPGQRGQRVEAPRRVG